MTKTGLKENPLFQKTASPRTAITEKRQAIRCSYYISPEIVKQIEKTRYDLIMKYNKRISRSKIIEIAINYISNDLDINQDKSILVKYISKI